MKALIISDDTKVSTALDFFFKSKKFDTIIYKWLLKALDNIEEIRPDCVILSSSEYPRHWKTLVQFLKSGLGGNKIAVFLYEPSPLSKEDEEKAALLGINGYITNFENDQLNALSGAIDEYFDIKQEPVIEPVIETAVENIPSEPEAEPVIENIPSEPEPEPSITETPSEPEPSPVEETPEESVPTIDNIFTEEKPEEETKLKNTGHFIFTHPYDGSFVSGKYINLENNKLTCKLYKPEILNTFLINTKIPELTYFDGNEAHCCKAKLSETLSLNNERLAILTIEN